MIRPAVDWAAYDTCPTCRTPATQPCTVTAGGSMPHATPHPARTRTDEPPLFDLTKETR